MTDITPASAVAPLRAGLSRQLDILRAWMAAITRAEINAFGAIALLVAVLIGAFSTFGLAGLGAVYIALVPFCFIALILITLG